MKKKPRTLVECIGNAKQRRNFDDRVSKKSNSFDDSKGKLR